jgi:hypothetical protein
LVQYFADVDDVTGEGVAVRMGGIEVIVNLDADGCARCVY